MQLEQLKTMQTEQSNFSRDLHDGIAQNLAALNIYLEKEDFSKSRRTKANTSSVTKKVIFLIITKVLNTPYTDVSYTTGNFMWIGFIAAITNSILGDTISYLFYSANTSIPQVDNAVQGIYVVTQSLTFAAYFGGTVTNLIDKVFSATVSLFVYRFYQRKQRRAHGTGVFV